MNDVFEFDYHLEMYKPATQRGWGYYALCSCQSRSSPVPGHSAISAR
jgi:uncharacterized protein YcaQ